MTEKKIALLFVNDFADRGEERFYFVFGNSVKQVSADQVVKQEAEIICHDYWLIAPALYKKPNHSPVK